MLSNMADSTRQKTTTSHELSILRERTTKFLGKARISLESLQFPGTTLADLQRQNVDRLKQVFILEGCQRLDPERHIPGLISPSDLQGAINYTAKNEVTSETLLNNPDTLPPFLRLPPHTFIECLRGKHRITATKETTVLPASDKWWIVDLYAVDIAAEGRRELVEQYSNSQNFTDGLIYLQILHYQSSRQKLAEQQWWARLTKSKRNILKRFLRHPKLADGFAKLREFEAVLLQGFKIGTLLEIMSTRLDEEILCYLNQISSAWTTIVGRNSTSKKALDSHTVTILQSKAPGVCESEYKALKQDMAEGLIFSLFDHDTEHPNILQNLTMVQCPIPTLATLRKDLKYLDACARAVRQVVFGSQAQLRCSLSEEVLKSFTNVNQEEGFFRLELQDSTFQRRKASEGHGPFEVGYRQLHLYAMRNIFQLSPTFPRQHGGHNLQRREQDPFAWSAFAELAFQLGFDSKEIQRLRAQNPERTLAATMLATGQYEGPELIIDDVSQRLKSAKRKASPISERFMAVPLGSDRSASFRCGWMTEADHEATRRYLYLDVLASDLLTPGCSISILQVRKLIYESFFGMLDTTTSFNTQPQDVTLIGTENTTHSAHHPGKRRKISQNAANSDSLSEKDLRRRSDVVMGQQDDVATSSGQAQYENQDTIELRQSLMDSSAQQNVVQGPGSLVTIGRKVGVSIFQDTGWVLKQNALDRADTEKLVSELLDRDRGLQLYDTNGFGLTVQNCFENAFSHYDRTVYVASRDLDRRLFRNQLKDHEDEEL